MVDDGVDDLFIGWRLRLTTISPSAKGYTTDVKGYLTYRQKLFQLISKTVKATIKKEPGTKKASVTA